MRLERHHGTWVLHSDTFFPIDFPEIKPLLLIAIVLIKTLAFSTFNI